MSHKCSNLSLLRNKGDTVYVIWGKASAKGGQKVVEAASEELKELYRQIFIPITENLEGSGGLL